MQHGQNVDGKAINRFPSEQSHSVSEMATNCNSTIFFILLMPTISNNNAIQNGGHQHCENNVALNNKIIQTLGIGNIKTI